MSQIISEKNLYRDGQTATGRRKVAGEMLIYTGTSVPLNAIEELENLASARNLKLAKVVRNLLLRGLAAYHRDGCLEEPVETSQDPM